MQEEELVTITHQEHVLYLEKIKETESLRKENKVLKENQEELLKKNELEINSMKNQLMETRKQVHHLSKKGLMLSRELYKREEKILILQDKLEKAIIDHKQESEKLTNESSTLSQKVQVLRQKLSEIENQNMIEQQQRDQLELKVESLKSENQNLQKIRDELNNNEGQILVYRCYASKLEKQRKESDQTIEELQSKNQELERNIQHSLIKGQHIDRQILESKYFFNEMKDQDKCLKMCQTIIKLHFLHTCKEIKDINPYDKRKEIFEQSIEIFLNLLFNTITLEYFMQLMV